MVKDELLTLSTCVLIDEFEAGLKQMEDYKVALNHTFNSALPLHDFCKLSGSDIIMTDLLYPC